MLKPVLRNKLLPEYKMLYDNRVRLSDDVFREIIANNVRHIRKSNRSSAVNPLDEKLSKFGNEGGWYRARANEYLKLLYKVKNISGEYVGHWRSIEFELIFKSQEDRDDFGHAVRHAGLANYVTIKNDISIKRNEGDSHGVPNEVTLSYRVGEEKSVRDFCRCLKGRAYVNKTCGTHFHIDMRHMTAAEAMIYGQRLARCVPALRMLLPKSRRESKYCRKTINSTDTNWEGQNNQERYAFVNMSAYGKFKTLEVRGHSGTINAEKILNWIKLCEHIMLTDVKFLPMVSGDVTNIEDLISQYRLDDKLASYVRERYAKVNHVDTEGEEKLDEVEAHIPAILRHISKATTAQPAPVAITQPSVDTFY